MRLCPEPQVVRALVVLAVLVSASSASPYEKAQGWTYVTTVQLHELGGVPQPPSSTDPAQHADGPTVASGFVRITRHGHVYYHHGNASGDGTDAPEHLLAQSLTGLRLERGGGARTRGRLLASGVLDSTSARGSGGVGGVVGGTALDGQQERAVCPRYATYPYSAVGMLTGRRGGSNGLLGCSGTLIGPDVVLTAAHCVYSREDGAFLAAADFSPGRSRGPSGSHRGGSGSGEEVRDPFGPVPWTHVTTYARFVYGGSEGEVLAWDLAVVRLAERVGIDAGWMGIERLGEGCGGAAGGEAGRGDPAAAVAAAPPSPVQLAGYPVDTDGVCVALWCSIIGSSSGGACDEQRVQPPGEPSMLNHDCATAAGHSGSPLWTLRRGDTNTAAGGSASTRHRLAAYVKGVHTIAGTGAASGINSAVFIGPMHYASIIAWIAPSFTDGDAIGPSFPHYPVVPEPSGSDGGETGSPAKPVDVTLAGD